MSLFRYLRLLWRFAPLRSLLLLVLLLLSTATQGFGLLLLVPLIDVIDGGRAGGGSFVGGFVDTIERIGIPVTLGGLLALFLALAVIRAAISYGLALLSERVRLELLDDLRATGFDALLDARWSWHLTRRKSDMANLLMNEVARLGTALTFSLRLPVTLFSILAYSAVALGLSVWMTLCALGLGLALFLAMTRQHAIAREQGRALTEANRHVQQTVEEGLAGIRLIKILGSEARQSALMRTIRDRLRERMIAFGRLNALMTAIFQVSSALAMVALIYIGTVTLGLALSTLLVLVVLFARLAPLVQQLQREINALKHADAALDTYLDTLDRAAGEAEYALARGAAPAPRVSFGDAISFENVSFRHAGRPTPSLRTVSLVIPHGKTTAIMGPSGSGKSTIADLLTGLLRPSDGVVRVDGVALDDTNRLAWRRSVAYMPQDVFLFHDTIRNNLLWARPDADEPELEQALAQAAADFAFALPQGIDTLVGDMGHRLSGGEKQRIALARAILQRPRLMILDEATSALDPENEALIRRTIVTLQESITIVALGHRRSTLDFADQLIELKEGRVEASRPVALGEAGLSRQ